MEELSLRNYAYIGDAVWELYIREKTIRLTENPKKLHKITTDKVKASYQAELLNIIESDLTDAEQKISRRARNLPIPVGRRQIQTEYRRATSFEALMGWWYMNDKQRYNNIIELIDSELKF